ncbi:hypothetical protein MO987_23515 [Vibrio vulnificus]|nr:hypothetical protein [Vibrio vulnificus]
MIFVVKMVCGRLV